MFCVLLTDKRQWKKKRSKLSGKEKKNTSSQLNCEKKNNFLFVNLLISPHFVLSHASNTVSFQGIRYHPLDKPSIVWCLSLSFSAFAISEFIEAVDAIYSLLSSLKMFNADWLFLKSQQWATGINYIRETPAVKVDTRLQTALIFDQCKQPVSHYLQRQSVSLVMTTTFVKKYAASYWLFLRDFFYLFIYF